MTKALVHGPVSCPSSQMNISLLRDPSRRELVPEGLIFGQTVPLPPVYSLPKIIRDPGVVLKFLYSHSLHLRHTHPSLCGVASTVGHQGLDLEFDHHRVHVDPSVIWMVWNRLKEQSQSLYSLAYSGRLGCLGHSLLQGHTLVPLRSSPRNSHTYRIVKYD